VGPGYYEALSFFFVFVTTVSFVCNMLAVCSATFLTIWAPNLAL
jgi:hypothetical protein